MWLLILHLGCVPVSFPASVGKVVWECFSFFTLNSTGLLVIFLKNSAGFYLSFLFSQWFQLNLQQKGCRIRLRFSPQTIQTQFLSIPMYHNNFLMITRPLNNLALFSLDRWWVVGGRKEAERKVWGIIEGKFLRDWVIFSGRHFPYFLFSAWRLLMKYIQIFLVSSSEKELCNPSPLT